MAHTRNPEGRLGVFAPAVVLLLALCLLAAGAQALMVPMDDAALAKGADEIVRGHVTGVSSGWDADHTNIVTTATVHVQARAKGQGPDTLELAAIGGTADGITQWAEDQPVLVTGADAYFFVKTRPDRSSTVYGGQQGMVPIANGRAMKNATMKGAGIPVAEFDRYLGNLSAGEGVSPPPGAEPVTRAIAGTAPVIANIAPSSAPAGTGATITITGSGFGSKASRESNADVAFLYRYTPSLFYQPPPTSIWATGYPYFADNTNGIVSWSDSTIVVNVPVGVTRDGYQGGASSGYVYVFTDDGQRSALSPFTVTFSYGRVHWATAASFSINPGRGGPSVVAAIRNASDTWNGAIPSSTFRLVYQGTSTDTTFGMNGASLISFGPGSDFPSPNTIAGASVWTDASGTIVEADIELNEDMLWTTETASGNTMSVEAISVHELGHWLHLRDLYGCLPGYPSDTGKVMFGYNGDPFGNKNLKTLSEADAAGIRWIYPGTGLSVSSIAPGRGMPGSTVAITNLAGTGFQAGATVTLRRLGAPDIPATGVAVVSPTRITCQLGLPATTAPGAWDVVVTSPGGVNASLGGGFTVTTDPWYVPHVLPCTVEAEDYDITGNGTAYLDLTPANDGGAYRADAVDIEEIAGGNGLCDVREGEWTSYTVESPAVATYGVTLGAGSPDGAPPRTVDLLVDGVTQQTVTVPITGGGPVIPLYPIAARLTVPAGRHAVTLRYHGGSMSVDALIFDAPSDLAVASIVPASGTPGSTIATAHLAGTGFHAGATVALRRSGAPDIPVTGVTVASPASITCRLSLPADASTGAWNVVVADPGGGQATLPDGFTVSPPETYAFAGGWGMNGSGDGELYYPRGIAIDGEGYVYIADEANHRVEKFTRDGVFVVAMGTETTWEGKPGTFSEPGGIAVDDEGYVYVTDMGRFRVLKFRSDGTFVKEWGTEGTGDGQFYGPTGVAVDGAGTVYVVDPSGGQRRVQKFTSDGTFLAVWDSYGKEERFGRPSDVAVDGAGNVYVTDAEKNLVLKFAPSGVLITTWGMEGSGVGQFSTPRGITVASDGSVFVVDTDNHRVQKFTADGAPVASWGTEGSGDGEFLLPWDVAVPSDGSVFVLDCFRPGVREFARQGTRPLIVPGGSGLPADRDGDGLYEDVNGNGRYDFADVVLFFNQLTWIATHEPLDAFDFDYNSNFRLDFADVVWLFNHL